MNADTVLDFMNDHLQDKLGFIDFTLTHSETDDTIESDEPCYGEFGYGRSEVTHFTKVDVYAHNFCFETCGAKVYGNFAKPVFVGAYDVFEDENLGGMSEDNAGYAAHAIHAVCGNINYGEDNQIAVTVGWR